MLKHLRLLPGLLLLGCSLDGNNQVRSDHPSTFTQDHTTIAGIPVPPGYERIPQSPGSFGAWLRTIPLKKDSRVYLYNGTLKRNQDAQFAVLDISVGKEDLQQCADAIMRIRSEYFFFMKKYDSIMFLATSGQSMVFAAWKKGLRFRISGNRLVPYQAAAVEQSPRQQLNSFLPFVYTYAGTLSLQRQLKKAPGIMTLQPGDVLVRGGSPGHAMLVADVAINDRGKKIFLLAQSYMPAQDIHIVKNPLHASLSPWYELDETASIITPEWKFGVGDLYKW